MKASLEKFESGWVGLSLGVRPAEIDTLIAKLEALRNGNLGHFHLRNDDLSGQPGLADVEISLMGDEVDNLRVE
jgi:hypothetical protein